MTVHAAAQGLNLQHEVAYAMFVTDTPIAMAIFSPRCHVLISRMLLRRQTVWFVARSLATVWNRRVLLLRTLFALPKAPLPIDYT